MVSLLITRNEKDIGMKKLTEKQIIDYFHRSFAAVDGLWFMKIEEKFGFETALDIDNEVWKVVPKIQARELKAMLGELSGMEALKTCVDASLTVKGFRHTLENDASGRGFKLIARECPWHNVMIKSGREHLSGRVGERICRTEYDTWAAEFGGKIRFSLEPEKPICAGGDICVLHFAEIA
jgi:hypothetical protein